LDPRPLVLACEDEERIVELLRVLTEPLGADLVAARDTYLRSRLGMDALVGDERR